MQILDLGESNSTAMWQWLTYSGKAVQWVEPDEID